MSRLQHRQINGTGLDSSVLIPLSTLFVFGRGFRLNYLRYWLLNMLGFDCLIYYQCTY